MLAASSSRLTPEIASRAAMSLWLMVPSASRLSCAARVCRPRLPIMRSTAAEIDTVPPSMHAGLNGVRQREHVAIVTGRAGVVAHGEAVTRGRNAIDGDPPAVDIDVATGRVSHVRAAVDRVGVAEVNTYSSSSAAAHCRHPALRRP